MLLASKCLLCRHGVLQHFCCNTPCTVEAAGNLCTDSIVVTVPPTIVNGAHAKVMEVDATVGQKLCSVLPTSSCFISMQDWLDIDFAIQMSVDFIAVSFVKTPDVINNLKSYLSSRSDKTIEIVAKIESHDSVPNAQHIIEASDGVMIARGDLGTVLLRLA